MLHFPVTAEASDDQSVRTRSRKRRATAPFQKEPSPGRLNVSSAKAKERALAIRLLDGVVIAENLESAFRVKAANPALGVATLAGEFISREGVVRGGQSGRE